MIGIDKTKPQADHKGLNTLLGYAEQATDDIIADDPVLTILKQIEGVNLYHDTGSISINEGDRIGEVIETTGKVIAILADNGFNPASLAIFTPNSNSKPELTDPNKPYALVLGDALNATELYATKSIHEGIELYQEFMTQDLAVAILVSINPWHFNDMVKYYSLTKQITVTATLENKKQITEPLKGLNVRAVITQLVPLHDIASYDSETFSSVMSTAEVIELEPLDWTEPESLTIDPSKPTPYPIDAWQGLLKQVIEKIADYTQVPLATAGQCVLGAMAHLGQRFVDAPMGYSHKPTSLILITEGESGSGKTEAMNLSHKEIFSHEKLSYKNYLKELDEWQARKADCKNQKEIAELLKTHPKPINPETIFKDSTIEPIKDKFINGDLVNGSWTTDDGGQFFNGYSMQSNTAGNALTAITDLYSGGTVSSSRSQKNAFANPKTQAHGVRFTLMLMAQRVILEPALSNPLMNGQGFLARALIACPEDLRGKRVWNDPQRRKQNPYKDPDLIAYWQRCNSLLDPSAINDPEQNKDTGRYKMRWHDSKAEKVFYDYMQKIEDRMAIGKQYEFTKAYASRMAENTTRIASLIAFFDERKTITADDIERAYKLVEYSTAERLRYLDATPANDESDTQKLSKWLIDKARNKNPHKLNRTYVSNGAPNPMRKNSRLLQAELDKLESAGHIRQDMEGRKNIILVNPRLYS